MQTQTHPPDSIKICEELDMNGLRMAMCLECKTHAHARTKEEALSDLSRTVCTTKCTNCSGLRLSYSSKPAIPLGGNSHDLLHVCPIDDSKWWQHNRFFHLWTQVTSDLEWKILQENYQE
jgi:hypothetical protein